MIGWCFAHAAGDVISFKLGKRISVSELSTTYFKHRSGDSVEGWEKDGFQEGGWSADAMKLAKKKGVCLEEDMPTEHFKVMTGVLPSGEARTVTDVLVNMKRLKGNLVEMDLEEENKNLLYVAFPHLSQEEIIQAISKNSLKKAWELLVDGSCKGRKLSLEGLKVKSPFLTRLSKRRSITIINRQLEKGNVLSVSYYASFLSNLKAKKSGPHASVIVGRRLNEETKECEYLIRNSWGTRCWSYDPALKCEKGNVWVGESLLKKNVRYVDYLAGEVR